MATSPTPQAGDFSVDFLGRYVCNGLDEALRSTDGGVGGVENPFTIIVIGGGSFGPIFAQHLFSIDAKRAARILVLEAGPLALPEHSQNLPTLGNIDVWSTPWIAPIPFSGLAFCLGGRSLFWGGWSPQLLEAEMPDEVWPAAVKGDLRERYFKQAAEQIGTDTTNDFIYGSLHYRLRRILFDGIEQGRVPAAIPLRDLAMHPLGATLGEKKLDEIRARLAGETDGLHTESDLLALLKLEAPLAVQTHTRSGFFPFNKFSAIPLMIQASRQAYSESGGDTRKRLMIVPNCPVTGMTVEGRRVTAVKTPAGNVRVPPKGRVVLAAGTIESTRLALLAFGAAAGGERIGSNLMAHLRSNFTVRVTRDSLGGGLEQELQESALFVKGRNQERRHFHLQISAAGLKGNETNPDVELWRKVPDIDTMHLMFDNVSDEHVAIIIRGIGEMEPSNPHNNIRLSAEYDRFGIPKALVSLFPTLADLKLWDTMDETADAVAKVFANGRPFEVVTASGRVPVTPDTDLSQVQPYLSRRDGLGTTHHEAGTLWMGSADKSVTDEHGRLHASENVFVVGPALLPTIGSPNPMLSGVALARRLADHVADRTPYIPPEPGFNALFDGMSVSGWQMAGPGGFRLYNGTLEAQPGGDIGLYWCATPMPANFVLKLEWRRSRDTDNSGVFLRFPHPGSKGYENTAYVAVDFGFEVQIDEFGLPHGRDVHSTGAIYEKKGDSLPQQRNRKPALGLGHWNEFEIDVRGHLYVVKLNGELVTRFENKDQARGIPSSSGAPSYIGLQAHSGTVAFRNIRFKELSAEA